jgi:hypothetical protein
MLPYELENSKLCSKQAFILFLIVKKKFFLILSKIWTKQKIQYIHGKLYHSQFSASSTVVTKGTLLLFIYIQLGIKNKFYVV